jgi:hypothetical protein
LKATIIVDESGRFQALHLAPLTRPSDQSGAQAGLIAGPGQTTHEIDVPEQVVAAMTGMAETHQIVAELRKLVPSDIGVTL